MKSSRCRVLLLAFSAIVAGMIEPCVAQAQTVTPEALTNFQSFGKLGFPDVKGCPLVRVATGGNSESSDGIDKEYVPGFLVATNGDSFTVLTFDLDVGTYTKTAAGTPDFSRVGYEILNLRDEASARLESLLGTWRGPRSKLAWRNSYFVLAWACWRQGLDSLAQQFYGEAEKWAKSDNGAATFSTFPEDIQNQLGVAAYWGAVSSFGNLSINRPQLLAQFEAIIKNYPHSQYYQQAKEKADVLRQMIAEDEEHAKSAPKDLDQLPMQERVRELIFRLRERHDVLEGLGPPDAQLVALGYEAVPQLITSISSPILTRSVVRDHHGGPWASVMSVGDFTRNTLRDITGNTWGGSGTEAQAAAQAWWNALTNVGGKQLLVEGVSAGGKDAPFEADLLVAWHPDVAPKALMQGIMVADSVRTSLLEKLGKFPDDVVTDFLRGEMLRGPQLRSRVAAAYILRERGKPEAVDAMIQEWQKLPHQDNQSSARGYQVHSFLASCDSVPAIDALTHNFSYRPVEERLAVVEWVGETNRQFLGHPAEAQSPATLMAIEKFLVTALEDTEEWKFEDDFWEGMPGSVYFNGMRFCNPRVCDTAAFFLAESWPARYPMQLSPTYKGREIHRIECLNTWRVAHQLPTLPLPQPRNTPVAPSDAAKVTLIEWSPASVKPAESFAQCVGSLKNKLLRVEDIMGVITNFAHNPGPGVSGLRLQATKEEDLTGVSLTLTLLPGQVSTKDWGCEYRVQLGQNRIYECSWSVSVMERGRVALCRLGFVEAINNAATAPPKTPFEINMLITGF
jgi:hypothetical protein